MQRILSALFVLLLLCTLTAQAQPRVGVCTMLSNAARCRDAGASYIEESVGRFLVPDKSDAEFEAIFTKAALSPLPVYACNGFFPRTMRLTGDNADHKAALAYATVALQRAGRAGVKIIVLGSGAARALPDGYAWQRGEAQFIDFLKQLGPVAKKNGVVIAIEPLYREECNFINMVSEGVAIAKKVNNSNIRVLADFYHMMCMGEGPGVIGKESKYIVHCHVAEKRNRAVPGTCEEDLSPYYNALLAAKYKGCISLECRWTDFDREVEYGVPTVIYGLSKDNKLTSLEIAEGWRLLWDGSTSNGWQGIKKDGFPVSGWSMKYGMLHIAANGGKPSGGDIITMRKYGDFELSVDFKFGRGANSGIKYFITEAHDTRLVSAVGCEYQILDDENHPDAKLGIDGNRTLGSLYDIIPPYASKKRVDRDGFNTARIVVRGDVVEHWLNGKQILSYRRGDGQWDKSVAQSKFRYTIPPFGMARHGYILLQDHGEDVWFKNIKIREF